MGDCIGLHVAWTVYVLINEFYGDLGLPEAFLCLGAIFIAQTPAARYCLVA